MCDSALAAMIACAGPCAAAICLASVASKNTPVVVTPASAAARATLADGSMPR